MRKFYHLLVKSDFLKNSMALMSGTGTAALIQALASPVLTRIYSSADFGVFALFLNTASFFSLIVTARCEQAIILPEKEQDAAVLALISAIASVVVSMAIFCGMAVIFFTIKRELWLFFIPLVCLFMGFVQTGYYWLLRNKKFYILGSVKVLQATLAVGFSFLLALVLREYWGLVTGYTVGYLVTSILVLTILIKGIRSYLTNISKVILLNVIKRYKRFLLYLNLADAGEYLALYLPTLYLAVFFDKSMLGFYALAQLVTGAPVRIISAAVADVFKQKASFEYAKQGSCRNTFSKVFLLLAVLSSIVCVIFFIVAPYVFSLVFGSAWKIAGEYARILTIMLFFQFIATPLSGMVIIAEKTSFKFWMYVYLIIANSFSFLCGYYIFHSIKISLMLFAFFSSLKYICDLIISYKFCLGKKRINDDADGGFMRLWE